MRSRLWHRPYLLRRRYSWSNRYGYEFFLQIAALHIEDTDFAFKAAGDNVLAVRGKCHCEYAACMPFQLVEQLGGQVAAVAFLLELKALEGRRHLTGRQVVTLIEC